MSLKDYNIIISAATQKMGNFDNINGKEENELKISENS
jgi:hypothetical protein